MKTLFCNKCRKRIIPPKMLANITLAPSASITLKCGDPNCTGCIKIKSK